MAAGKYTFVEHILFPATRVNYGRLAHNLEGKTTLITGASFGIGECLAYLLANSGTQLVLVARTEEKLALIKKEIEAGGGKALIFPADLSKPEQVMALINALADIPGGIDIIINNAGKSIMRPISESLERYHDFTRTMAVNYFGPVQLMLALIPMIEKKKGHIINISAINVLLAPAPYWAAYQSSKAAFDNWFRCVSPELNAAGLNTTSIYLPLVRTRMIAPTQAYDKMPAMSASHAAKIICKAINNKRKKIAPWWLIFGQLASVIFRRQWEYFTNAYLKKKPYGPRT